MGTHVHLSEGLRELRRMVTSKEINPMPWERWCSCVGAWIETGRHRMERQPDHFPASEWRKSRKKKTYMVSCKIYHSVPPKGPALRLCFRSLRALLRIAPERVAFLSRELLNGRNSKEGSGVRWLCSW